MVSLVSKNLPTDSSNSIQSRRLSRIGEKSGLLGFHRRQRFASLQFSSIIELWCPTLPIRRTADQHSSQNSFRGIRTQAKPMSTPGNTPSTNGSKRRPRQRLSRCTALGDKEAATTDTMPYLCLFFLIGMVSRRCRLSLVLMASSRRCCLELGIAWVLPCQTESST